MSTPFLKRGPKCPPWWAWLFGFSVMALWFWGAGLGQEKQRRAGALAKEGEKIVADMNAFDADPRRNQWDKRMIEDRQKRFDDKSKEFFDEYGKPKPKP